MDLVQYSLRGEASRWFKNNKTTFTSWKTFVQGLKETFLSPFFEVIAFKRLDSYTQGINQPVRSFYNEVVKLCNEADSSMSDFTKLRNLLNKTKPTLQLEIRKKKPSATKEFLQYAIEVEELFRLSNIDISDDPNKANTTNQITSAVTLSRSANSSTKPNTTVPSNTHTDNNYYKNYEDNNYNNDSTYCQTQSTIPSNSNYQQQHQSHRFRYQTSQPFTYPNCNLPSSNNSSRTSYQSPYKQKNISNYKNNNNRNNNHASKGNLNTPQRHQNTIANIPSLLDPLPSAPSFENCSRCQQAGYQVPACPHF